MLFFVYFPAALNKISIFESQRKIDNKLWYLLTGYAILSKFEIQGKFVTFHKKFLQSDAYRRALAAQKPVITEFGTKAYPDPNKGLISRLVSSIVS